MVGEFKAGYKGESTGSGCDDMRETMRIMMKDMRYVKTMTENNAKDAKEAKEQATAAKQAAFAASSVEGEVGKLSEQVVTKENAQEVMRGTGKYVTGEEVGGMIKEAMNNMSISNNTHTAGRRHQTSPRRWWLSGGSKGGLSHQPQGGWRRPRRRSRCIRRIGRGRCSRA
eukprot:4536234-Pyramimonas_sp.AAC.1